jgi:putative addiction module CopG family antidote
MKISISLPDEDIQFVDDAASTGRYGSRSAAIHAAVSLLRDREYHDSYAAAWDEWERDGEGAVWDKALGDGIG